MLFFLCKKIQNPSYLMKFLTSSFLFFLILVSTVSLDNGAAQFPPLIITTAKVGCQVNEVVVRNQLEQMVNFGLVRLGYKYFLIQDCWQSSRNSATGIISEDPTKFPSGIKNLVNFARQRQISIGLGTDIGSLTNLGKPGSKGYQQIDAVTYASWGISMVNIGNSENIQSSRPLFTLFSQFLLQASPKIMISIDIKGQQNFQYWAPKIANTWSTVPAKISSFQTLENVLINQEGLQNYAQSGSWNDAGIISTVLNGNQFGVQFVTWLGLKSPIKLTIPLEDWDSSKRKYILNQELLAIHQDKLKKQARLIRHMDYWAGWQEIWGCPLSRQKYALFFINGVTMATQMTLSLKKEANLTNFDSYWIRDPILGQNLGSSSSDKFTIDKIESHSVQVRILNF